MNDLRPGLFDWLIGATATGILALMTTAAQADFEADWKQLIAAAQKEGKVAIAAGGAPSRQYAALFEVFHKKFGVEVEVARGGANTTISRILAERRAGRNTMDLNLISIRIHNQRLVPTNALVPFQSLLIYPEVLDKSKWHGGQHWYGDKETKYVFFYTAGVVDSDRFWYNTQKVSGEEIAKIASIKDFLDPKWKGKIQGQAMEDPSGIRQMIDAWQDEALGPDFVKKYLTGGNVTFSADRRILETWLVKGRYPVKAVSTSEEELKTLAAKGLPVKQVSLPREVAELQASGSGCCISAFNDAPHPNAAKLFVNWFLSKEGQTLIHTTIPNIDRSSLRNDVPVGMVSKEHIRQPSKKYRYPDADPTSGERNKKIQEQIMAIWKSRR